MKNNKIRLPATEIFIMQTVDILRDIINEV